MEENREIVYSEYTKEDFDGYFHCIDSFYHNGYPFEDFLHRDSLHRYIDAGDLILTVAKDGEGRIVGTSGALRCTGTSGTSVSLTLRCVSQECRGLGIGTEQERFLLRLIEKRFSDLRSVTAEAVTNDTYSQRTLMHRGFTCTGLCLMQYDNQAFFPELIFEPKTYMTLSVWVRAVRNDPVAIYAPQEHREYIKRTYDELGVPCSFIESASAVQTDAEYHWEVYKNLRSSKLTIDRVGKIGEQLKKEIAHLIDTDHTIVCFLSMSQTGAIEQYREMIEMGFVFSGLKPLLGAGECVILSHIGNHDHVDDMILPEGKEHIMNYILGGIHK